MIRKAFWTGAILAAGMIAGARTSEAQSGPLQIRWHPENAQALGSGCPDPGDAQVLAFGPDMTILFRKVGIHLEKGDGPLVALRQCSVRIPVTVPEGALLAQLTRTITYGVNKSTNSDGMITALSGFFSSPVKPFSITIPREAMQDPGIVQKKQDLFYLLACGHAMEGLFRGDMTLSARRDDVNEEILVGGGTVTGSRSVTTSRASSSAATSDQGLPICGPCSWWE